jgi:hypothetical protein
LFVALGVVANLTVTPVLAVIVIYLDKKGLGGCCSTYAVLAISGGWVMMGAGFIAAVVMWWRTRNGVWVWLGPAVSITAFLIVWGIASIDPSQEDAVDPAARFVIDDWEAFITREDPLEPGAVVLIGDWEVSYRGAEIAEPDPARDRTNLSEEELHSRLFATMAFEATFLGAGTGDFVVDFNAHVLVSDATTYGGAWNDSLDGCRPSRDPLWAADNDARSGETMSGNGCIAVPAQHIDDALVFFTEYGQGDSTPHGPFYWLQLHDS